MNSQGISALVARVLLGLMFLIAGAGKFAGLAGTAGYIASKGLPLPDLLAFATALLEVAAALMLIVGWQARWAALALAAFTVLATLLFHNYWALPAEEQMMQRLMFMKNLAIVGGLLMVFAFGAGLLSLDPHRGGGRT